VHQRGPVSSVTGRAAETAPGKAARLTITPAASRRPTYHTYRYTTFGAARRRAGLAFHHRLRDLDQHGTRRPARSTGGR